MTAATRERSPCDIPPEVREYNTRKARQLFDYLRCNPFQVFELRTIDPDNPIPRAQIGKT